MQESSTFRCSNWQLNDMDSKDIQRRPNLQGKDANAEGRVHCGIYLQHTDSNH